MNANENLDLISLHDFNDWKGQTVYNFGDGKGPVPAHRHKNPDGSVGGWVADTAYVAPTMHVMPRATVGGDRHIHGSGWVGEHTTVYNSVVICNRAKCPR